MSILIEMEDKAMSSRIDQLLEVIQLIQSEFRINKGNCSIKEIRPKAVKQIAEAKDIVIGSVYDKFIRQLAPEIRCTNEFDTFLSRWLKNGSMELREILLGHSVDDYDKSRIKELFNSPETFIKDNRENEMDTAIDENDKKPYDEIDVAFNALLEILKKCIEKLNQKGAESFESGNYERVESIKSKATKLTTIHKEIEKLRANTI